jgi:hypothetical protein
VSSGLRWTAAVVLALVAAVLLTLTAVGRWAQTSILDTGGFTSAVAPVASDPAVQQALAAEATTRTMDALTKAVDEQAGFLAPVLRPLVPQLQPTVEKAIVGVLASDQFSTAWAEATRTLHDQLVTSLRGGESTGVTTSDNAITVDLALLKGPITESLDGSRLASLVLDNVDLGSVSVPVDVQRLRAAVWVADHVGWWTPVVALLALVLAVLAAPRRPVALLLAGGLVLVAAALTLVGFNQSVATQATTLTDTGRTLSAALIEALDDGLLRNLAVLAGVGVVLGLAGGLWLLLSRGGNGATTTAGGTGERVVGSSL